MPQLGLKDRLQAAGRQLLLGQQKEAIASYLSLRDDILNSLRTGSNESESVVVGEDELEPKLTLAEALKNLSVAEYQRAAYPESARFAEEALKYLRELDTTCATVAKAMTRVKLCLVQAYFVQAPTRERYDRMGSVLEEEGELPTTLAQYKVAIDFRLEQRDQDVVVEHSNLPQNRKCLRFYFQAKDLPLYRPHLRRVEYSVLSSMSSHGENNAANRKRFLHAVQAFQGQEQLSVLTYHLGDGFMLFQLLSAIGNGFAGYPSVSVRCVERSDRHMAYLVSMLALLDRIGRCREKTEQARLCATFYFLFCSPVIPDVCFSIYGATLDVLVGQSECPLGFIQCPSTRWQRIKAVLREWRIAAGDSAADLMERQSFQSLLSSRQGWDTAGLEESRRKWTEVISTAEPEQLQLFKIKRQGVRAMRKACQLLVEEASPKQLARLQELKAVFGMPGAEADALFYEENSRLPVPTVLDTEDSKAKWRSNPLHVSSLYGIPLYNA